MVLDRIIVRMGTMEARPLCPVALCSIGMFSNGSRASVNIFGNKRKLSPTRDQTEVF